MKRNFLDAHPNRVAPIRRILTAILLFLLAIQTVVLADSAVRLQIGLLPAPAGLPVPRKATPGHPAIQLQLLGGVTNGIYRVQSSTNLIQWRTIMAVKSGPIQPLPLGNLPTTGGATFYRALGVSGVGDTNPPAWSNGVGGTFTLTSPTSLLVNWREATDDTGVAQYRLYLNGALLANLLGNVLSYELPINLRPGTELRIQAVDPFDNATDLLPLIFLPGEKLLAVSDDSGRVYTSFVQSDGNFSPFQQIANFGVNDRGLGIGDFDRDGWNDLIAAYPSGNTLVPFFYKGQGDGSYAPGVALPTTPGANGYAMDGTVGDFDADGNLDFVFNGNDRFAMFYWGNGDGTFTVQVKDWGDGNYYYGRGMAAGDFNEDGRTDIARATCCNGYLKVLLSNGDRTFIETNLVATGLANNDPYAVAAGDFDEDGHLDLIVAGGSSGDVSFLKGLGNGSFTNITGTSGLWANLNVNTFSGLEAFDYNGDGHLDLVMTTANGQAFFWAGLGNGKFSTNRVTLNTGMSGSEGISAPPRPPRVDVQITPTDPVTNINGTMTFRAMGTGVTPGDTFLWSFGDSDTNRYAWTFTNGMASMGQSITHTFTKEGRFLTRLLHTDHNGILSSRGTWATVQANPPISQPGGPYAFGELAATQAVWYASLDGSASTDDFGIVKYIWSFGDGTSATNGPIITHGWSGPGVWNVGLTVVDASGLAGSNHTTITFTPGAPPVAAISGPVVVDETAAVNGAWTAAFSATNSSDDVAIWKYEWNFGDGQTASGPNVTTAYHAIGTYNVKLTVTDNANQTNTTSHSITVKANNLPVAAISGPRLLSEAVATNGQWFGVFSGTNSTDDRGIYRYDWNFGDGTTGSGATVTHNYAGVGIYPLVLTVTDFGNQTAATTQNVVVIAGDPPVARITADTLTPEGSQPVNLSGINSTDDHGILDYKWLLPPQLLTFDGIALDGNRWKVANTVQNDKLNTTGQGGWGSAYFFSSGIQLGRGTLIEARVDTSSGTSHAMFGLRNQDNSSGSYDRLVYSIYFADGAVQIYEYGNYRGSPTNYSKGTSYDIRVESKPAAGASYYLRPSGSGGPLVKIFETDNYSDSNFGVAGSIYDGVFGFDDLKFTPAYGFRDISASVFPGGPVTLTVTDNAFQTNSTSIIIQSITGAPPVAIISGPTNSPAGVNLTYAGYLSSDDHAIASYTWDFGDGSPLALGPSVTHAYPLPGVYTNTLTVRDYAGQTDVASSLVFIGNGNQLACIPWRIIGGIEYPHETYAGKTITLKAVARNVPLPFAYVWDFGDNSATFTNTANTTADAYALQASHAYSGLDGTPFNATIRIILTNGATLLDTYPILLRPKTLDTERNISIDEGLWYLHKTQNRFDLDSNNKGGSWTEQGYSFSPTASAVHAFGINGHLMSDDAAQDPYVETVQRGINYSLTTLVANNISPQAYGDPDGNHNGIGLSANSGRAIYETAALMDALVATARPELIAAVGPENVKGRPFRDIMQDLVDLYCWGQFDDPNVGGGWRYEWNQAPDNSACQWGAIGMAAAEQFWGIAIPAWVKERNQVWLAYSMTASDLGGFGYTGAGSAAGQGPGGVDGTTPSAMIQIAFDGLTRTNLLWIHGENYLANYWSTLMSLNNVYAHYAIAKALRTALPQPVSSFATTGKDWFNDPNDGLARTTINFQRADGSWDSDYRLEVPLSTSWSIIILSSSLFQRGPVAVIHARPNPTAVGFPVVFDGSSSFHQHPSFRVVEYRWDFNAADGLDFDHPDAYGPIVTNRFGFFGTNIVTLQVRDNATPQLNDNAAIEIRTTLPPYPPTADAGGPYLACVGQDVHLDGSGSFDVDGAQGDYIQSWNWEVDGLTPYDFNDGVTGAHAVIRNGYPAAGQYNVGLLVRDATSIVFPTLGLPDLTNVAFTTVFVYNRVITNLVGRAKDNKIQLVWTKAGDYAVVTRSTQGPDRGFVEIGRTASAYATFLDTNVDYNVPYFYRLYAYQNGQAAPLGISDPINVVSLPRSFESCGPYFVGTPSHEATVGKLYEITLQARERQNNPFAYALLAGPNNLTLNTTNGLVSFQPTPDQLGDQFVSFAVTNLCGTNVLSYTLTVFNPSNLPPIVNVHGPYSGVAGQPVQFSSAGTYDPDTNALAYVWAFGDGVFDTNANPTHAYPAPGNYTVALYVNDGHGGTATAQTQAHISRANRLPIANAGRDQLPLVGQTVILDGSGSWDADLDPLTYRWDIVLHPPNSSSTLSNAFTARPSFVIDQPGFYVVRLIVNDGRTDSAPDAVTIVTANSPPIAYAGRDQRVLQGNTAQLDGSGSYDVDLQPLNYRWTLVSVPTNSTATLTNANTARPTFGVDLYGLYIAELIVNDGLVDSAPYRVRVSTGNLHPEIVSTPTTRAVPNYAWSYHLLAYDPDGTNLTFTLLQSPPGLTLTPQGTALNTGDTDLALLAWTPTRAQFGSYPVQVLLTDAEGATNSQSFTINVGVDTQPPSVFVALSQGETNQFGQWAAQLGTTAGFRVVATDNVGVVNQTLNVANQPVTLDSNGVGYVTATNAGLWPVLATATDAEGNVGVTNTSIFFYDPNASNTIYARILSPAYGGTVTKPVAVIGTITNATDLLSYRVDFARAADVNLGDIAIEAPQFTTLTNVMLPAGTRSITNQILAQFDPTMLLNDDYVIRLVASDGRNLWYEPALVSVSGNLKHGEFHLEFTDLSVPVAGVPITITRVYDTRQANQNTDFGFGWSLGVQDARIRKTLRNGTMFLGSKVYLNTPAGRRVGFTAAYQPSSWLFSWIGDVILQPDAGVEEQLDIEGHTVIYSGGSFYGGLGDENFNPSTFRLTTKDGSVYTYHDTQGLQNVLDLHGNQLVLTRDGIFHFSAGSQNYDQSVPFIRDAQGRISEIIDPAGKRLTYAYDARGDLRSFTDQVTNLTQYLYSTAPPHYLTNIIDPLGHSALRLEYDPAGLLVGIRDANGNLMNQNFPDPNTAVFQDANGHTNIVRYDDNGNEVMKARPGISTNYFAYDANNRLTNSIDGRGYVTQRAYDSRGNLTNLTDALSNVTSIVYNSLNKPISITEPGGGLTTFAYDDKGGLTNVVNATGGQAAFRRDAQGRVTLITDCNGRSTFYDYQGGCSCGKPGKIVNPDGSFTLYEYNSQGQVTRKINESGNERLSMYDDVGHRVSVRDATTNLTAFNFSGSLKTSQTDPLGRSMFYAYNSANRLVAITNALGGRTQFEYDANGNRNAVIDPTGNITRFAYDAANRLVRLQDPVGHTASFSYDPAGNCVEAVDRNGRRRTFAYDALNHRTNELWWEGTNLLRSIEYSYNTLGLLTSANDQGLRSGFSYDSLGRMLSSTEAGMENLSDFTLTYAYDGAENVVSITDSWGVQVTSQYNARSQLEWRSWGGGGLPGASVHFQYDATRNRTNVLRFADSTGNLPAGGSQYQRTALGTVTSIVHANGSGEVLEASVLQRDLAQQIVMRSGTSGTSSYEYDLAGQLTNATASPGHPAENYAYDPNGNRTGSGYVLAANNQVSNDGTFAYGYDGEGNMVSRTNNVNGSRAMFAYDHRNRLIQVQNYGADQALNQTVAFVYDALDRRVSKSVNGRVERYVYDGTRLWADLDSTNGIASRYLMSDITDDFIARYSVEQGLVWFYSDQLGTIHFTANSAGAILATNDYSSFGVPLGNAGRTNFGRIAFSGREYDAETGLYYFRARYYDPHQGRFISQDPLGFTLGESNPYRYIGNNPSSSRDVLGMSELLEYLGTLQFIGEGIDVRPGEPPSPGEMLGAFIGFMHGFSVGTLFFVAEVIGAPSADPTQWVCQGEQDAENSTKWWDKGLGLLEPEDEPWKEGAGFVGAYFGGVGVEIQAVVPIVDGLGLNLAGLLPDGSQPELKAGGFGNGFKIADWWFRSNVGVPPGFKCPPNK